MMRYLVLPFSLLLVIVFQTTVPEILFFNSIGLELSLIFVIYAAFHLDLLQGAVLCFMLGFILDCISGTMSGFFTSIYVLLYFLSLLVSVRVYAAKVVFIMVFTTMCALLEGVMIMILYKYIYTVDTVSDMFRIIVPQALLLGVTSPLFFSLFHRLEVSLLHGSDTRSTQRA